MPKYGPSQTWPTWTCSTIRSSGAFSEDCGNVTGAQLARPGVPGTCRKPCSLPLGLLGCDGVALVQHLAAVAQVSSPPGHDAKLSIKQFPPVCAYSHAGFALSRAVLFFCTPRAVVVVSPAHSRQWPGVGCDETTAIHLLNRPVWERFGDSSRNGTWGSTAKWRLEVERIPLET